MSAQLRTILAVLAVVVIGYLWVSRGGGSDVPAAAVAGKPGEDAPAKAASKKAGIQASDIPIVIESVSKPYPGETFVRERSLFDYAQSPEELAAIEESRRLLAEQQAKEAAAAAERAEALRIVREAEAKEAAERQAAEAAERAEYLRLHPPKPVPPQFPYEYIGIIGPMDNPHAILRGGGNKLTYARAGDTIDGKFRVERVAQVLLDLTYTDPTFAGEITQVQRTFEGAAAGGGGAPPRR